jgi:hypothetical protein
MKVSRLLPLCFFSLFSSQGLANPQGIYLPQGLQNEMKVQMNLFLSSLNGVIEGLAEKDFEKIEKAARASGLKAAQNGPAIGSYVPGEFFVLGRPLHSNFQKIAEIAAFEDATLIIEHLRQVSNTCVACHAAFRFTNELE